VALCPGAVETPFIEGLGDPAVRRTRLFVKPAQPAEVAKAAVRAIMGSTPSHVVGWRNWLMAQSVRVSPRYLVARMGASMMKPPKVSAHRS
jgi:short-subunit dehydrogenase